jgi:hypothetical protein
MRIPQWMLPHQVQLDIYKGAGAYGPLFDPAVSARARVESRLGVTVAPSGNDVVYEAVATFGPETAVTPESRLTYGGRVYTVITVKDFPGPTGDVHHREVTLR